MKQSLGQCTGVLLNAGIGNVAPLADPNGIGIAKPQKEGEIEMTAAISPEAIMACAILAARHSDEPVKIENVSGLFGKLREAKIDEVGKVALRRIPRGLYSEDVEAFFGRLTAGGFADAWSPLVVNDRGFQLCLEMINEENESHPEALKKVARALGFDLAVIRNLATQQKLA
jgi:hypothetical protein